MSDNQKTEHLQNVLNELRGINRVMDKICRVRETNHIMLIIIDELMNLTKARQGVINLVSPCHDSELITVVRKSQERSDEIPYKVSSLITGWVLQHNTILKVDDLDADERFRGLSSEGGHFKSVLCCPMVVRGETIGLTSLVRDQANGPFNEDECRVAGVVATQSAQVLSNALLLEELARQNELLEISRRKLIDENLRLKAELDTSFGFENIVGKSPILKNVLILASKVSGNDSPLLISGPTGTGKELMARAIHYNSSRKDKPLVVKNCGIKTESLLEAELFGYVKGAFTGADRDKPGLFKEADGGSVFLDEIGDAPMATQVAILRVIETGEIRPVGATKTDHVDVRVISATNRDLKEEIKKGNFREDLFYRLNTFTINLPPLSQRRDDIPILVHYFLRKLKIKLGLENLSITPKALSLFTKYAWPGNIRQLENELERAAVVSSVDGLIDENDLSAEISQIAQGEVEIKAYRGQLREAVEKVECDLIKSSLAEHKGNILQTANALGLTRKGLKDKIARYGLSAND